MIIKRLQLVMPQPFVLGAKWNSDIHVITKDTIHGIIISGSGSAAR